MSDRPPGRGRSRATVLLWVLASLVMLATLLTIGTVLGIHPSGDSGCGGLLKFPCMEPARDPQPAHPLLDLVIFGVGTAVTVLLLRAADRRRTPE